MKIKIKALVNIDNKQILSSGEIIIHWIRDYQAYVTWSLFYNNSLIASKSENYFFNKNIDTKELLIKRVINKVENYRIGRKKIIEKIF